MATILLDAVSALAFALLILWVISIVAGKVSFIDAFWGSGFVIVAFAGAHGVTELGDVQIVALILLTLWGGRLSLYLLRRFLRHGEDPRYIRIIGERQGLSKHLFAGWFVFGLQGVLILLISAPILAMLAGPPISFSLVSYTGVALWLVGVFFEWIGDYQLSQFKKDPSNEGKVLDTGLWAWTRHPNYFGDACVWWGLWLLSGELVTVFSPLLMTFLLMKWSGVPLLEKSLKKRRSGYADYIGRTSSFFPRSPKQ